MDVNVLLALAWPNHPFHTAASRRMRNRPLRWATCALTQLGFIRLSSNRSAIPTAKSPGEAAFLLSRFTRDPHHVYLEALPPPAGARMLKLFAEISGTNQVTDCYLAALALRHKATLLTFDGRLRAVCRGAAVEVIVP